MSKAINVRDFFQRRPASLSPRIVSSPKSHQIYVSRSTDPFINLSIEHFLLQKSAKDSQILFLYSNRPCVVIGRNQNPWKEVNFQAINSRTKGDEILLVRRRSGGGAVFHDLGNVNFSVICPTSEFDRDKYAEMVVRALQKLGIAKSRVNKRHDIVLDEEVNGTRVDGFADQSLTSTTSTPKSSRVLSRKVSGSAYKLTRFRSLHHGTCLLSSPNIISIGSILHAPGLPFIDARGVESVSSPVANVGISNNAFEEGVIDEFRIMHSLDGYPELDSSLETATAGSANWIGGTVDESALRIPEIRSGVEELRSSKWIYQQTPQFETRNEIINQKPGRDIHPSFYQIPPETRLKMIIREGRINLLSLSERSETSSNKTPSDSYKGQLVHEIQDWTHFFKRLEIGVATATNEAVGLWLNHVFGR